MTAQAELISDALQHGGAVFDAQNRIGKLAVFRSRPSHPNSNVKLSPRCTIKTIFTVKGGPLPLQSRCP
eukprot:SAG31_NODE_156_length_22055_cov_105.227728_12_plen_69_part_00